MNQDNKSALIGAILIGVLIFSYPYFFPQEEREDTQKESEYTASPSSKSEDKKEAEKNIIKNDVKETQKEEQEEEIFTMENNKLKLTFSNNTGEITSAKIKNYSSYDYYIKKDSLSKLNKYQEPSIEIFNSEKSRFEIIGEEGLSTNNKDGIKFKGNLNKEKNKLTLKKRFDDNSFIEYIYILNEDDENLISFNVNTEGISNPQLSWIITTPKTEKRTINQEEYTGFYFQEKTSKEVDYVFDEEPYKTSLDLKWVSFTQQFFSSIFIASEKFDEGGRFSVLRNESDAYVKTLSFNTTLDDTENEYSIYIGPNDYAKLTSYDQGFEEIIPLGWGIFGWVNKYIVINVFDFLKNNLAIQNFGLLILVLTLIIKLFLSPLTYKSYLSQAKMKVLKPEIDKINEQHKKKDPMKAQKETMNLYRKAGVNPLGGCLPMLVQFPILIAMFRFFPASIDLRQQSFLWADDLSSYDSIYDLGFSIPLYGDHISLFTILMTLSTLVYTRMNMQMSSAQMPGMKWMMYLMPIMFLGILNNYASSLSYYYFLANIFTFSQMYLMRRFVDDEAILAKLEENKKKPRKKSKWQKKLEEMQKKQEQKMKKRKKR